MYNSFLRKMAGGLFVIVIGIMSFSFSLAQTTTPATTNADCTTEGYKPGFIPGKCVCADGYTRDDKGLCVPCSTPGVCCGVKLSTNAPFIGNCIQYSKNGGADTEDTTVVTDANAFPRLMGSMTKILVTVILLVCFMAILVGGVMIAASGGDSKRAGEGKGLIGKVIIAVALLGASGVILKLINPNFFK